MFDNPFIFGLVTSTLITFISYIISRNKNKSELIFAVAKLFIAEWLKALLYSSTKHRGEIFFIFWTVFDSDELLSTTIIS